LKSFEHNTTHEKLLLNPQTEGH